MANVIILSGRKPFEANTGLCKNLGASFQDADPLSYCYSDAEFENNGIAIVYFYLSMVKNILKRENSIKTLTPLCDVMS